MDSCKEEEEKLGGGEKVFVVASKAWVIFWVARESEKFDAKLQDLAWIDLGGQKCWKAARVSG